MLKCQAVKVVYEHITSKCKEIVIAVLRALTSFLSNAIYPKYRITNRLVLSQVKKTIIITINTNKITIYYYFRS